jgi:hypothetical protein
VVSDARSIPGGDEGGIELTTEMVLNAAVAFAGHVAAAAEQAVARSSAGGEDTALPPGPLRAAVTRQYLLETATLCLRRLGEMYDEAAADPAQMDGVDLLRSGGERARAATTMAEALGDLGLDLLDRLLP